MNLNWARKAAPGRAVTPALLFGLVLLFPIAALSHPGTLAVSPPMGWNSWDAYGFTLDETAFRNNATVLGKYRRYGWRYAIIDEGWYMANPLGTDRQSRDYQMDEHGRLVPAANRFPSASGGTGLTALADWSHHLGLQLGIHIVRGIPKAAVELNRQIAGSQFHVVDAADTADTCPWDDGNYGVRDNAAGQAYYDSLIKQYAAWKIDFLKVDCISNLPYRAAEIRQIATAIRHAGASHGTQPVPGTHRHHPCPGGRALFTNVAHLQRHMGRLVVRRCISDRNQRGIRQTRAMACPCPSRTMAGCRYAALGDVGTTSRLGRGP